MAKWKVDPEALELAELRLSLQHPVKVRVAPLAKETGRYRGLKDGKHQITLDKHQCAWEAGASLWHELTHAQQLEQDGEDFWPAYHDCCEDYEKIAAKTEQLNNLIPLCKPC